MTRPIRTPADLRGRRALVMGLARSGVAAARCLADAGAEVTVYDRRPAAELTDAVATLGERRLTLRLGVASVEAEALVAAADLLVTSPSISPDFPTTDPWLRSALRAAASRGADVVSEVDLFLRLTAARILGVTGTKGKTTTSTLLGEILAAGGLPHRVGGNIGRPLVEEAATLSRDTRVVLELSELQLPTISRGADVAVYTNIGADHLDRHGSVAAYRAVKARLALLTVERGGTVVLNADDPGCRDLAARLPGERVAWYGLDGEQRGATVVGDELVVLGDPLMPLAGLRLPGRHMLANALGAALAARLEGVEPEAVASGIAGFGGVPHRLELLGEWGGVRWVNDSQASIPVAAMAALDAFAPSPVVLIAGGQDKGLPYAELADAIAQRARAAVLIGETADELERLLAGRVPVQRAASMEEAVALAAGVAQPGDVALLAPAATSFDMFTDYAARGDAFRAAVRATVGGEGS